MENLVNTRIRRLGKHGISEFPTLLHIASLDNVAASCLALSTKKNSKVPIALAVEIPMCLLSLQYVHD